MTNINATALTYFEKELKGIQDASLQAFFYNALAVAPQSFHDDANLQEHVKTAYHILRGLLDQRGVKGTVRDALVGTTLLCDIMQNEFEEDMRPLHTVAVRKYLEKLEVQKDVNQGLWENVMRAVESHHGAEGASPLLDAKPGTAEYELAQAFSIARLGYVKLDWEAIYEEGKAKEEN
ncbi:hypothetical protein LAV82_22840 [Bacillus sp. ILBB4]|nr:hypothetical protein [Bacillus sp. ILBB4]